MINKVLRFLFAVPIVILLIFIVAVNVRLYSNVDNDKTIKLLNGLKNSVDNHADLEMQKLYPEGYVFFNALYGLAWCKQLKNNDKNSNHYKQNLREIERAFNKINSDTGRATFDKDLSLPYGAFYTGWCTYLLGNKLSIEKTESWNENEVMYFKQQCEKIASSISTKTYPVSYQGMAWPADATLCVASLSLHDELFPEKYDSIIKNWMQNVKMLLDVDGLIPHATNPLNGKVLERSRGSSQALILIFMHDIDSTFAKQQFKIFEDRFVDEEFGITAVREYAKDNYGVGDIDSGPVFLQMGAAATIVGAYTLNLYGDYQEHNTIIQEIDAFGFSIETTNQKKYLFGLLPIADAFIAWSSVPEAKAKYKSDFKIFHIYSFIVFSLFSILFWSFIRPPERNDLLHIPWD
jgi:hypothetical protein